MKKALFFLSCFLPSLSFAAFKAQDKLQVSNSNSDFTVFNGTLPVNSGFGPQVTQTLFWNRAKVDGFTGGGFNIVNTTVPIQTTSGGAPYIPASGVNLSVAVDGVAILNYSAANPFGSTLFNFSSSGITFPDASVQTTASTLPYILTPLYNSANVGVDDRNTFDMSHNGYWDFIAGDGSVSGSDSRIHCTDGSGPDITIEQVGGAGGHCSERVDDNTGQMDIISGQDVYTSNFDFYSNATPIINIIPGTTPASGRTFKTSPVTISIDSSLDKINGSTVTNGHDLIVKAEDNSNTGSGGNLGGDLYFNGGAGKLSTGTVNISTTGGAVRLGSTLSSATFLSNTTFYLQVLTSGGTVYQIRTSTQADFRIDAGGLRTLYLGTAQSGEAVIIGASSGANGTTVQGNPLTLGNASYATVMNGSASGLTINEPVKVNTSVVYSGATDANLWLNNPSSAGVFRLEGQDYAKFEFGAGHSGTTNTGKWQWYVRNDGANPPFMHLGLLNDAENSEQTGFNIFRSGNSATTFELGGTAQLMDGSLTVYGNTGTDIFKAQSTGGTTDVRMTGDSQANQYYAQFYFYDPEVGNGDNRVMGFQPRFDGSNPGDYIYTGAITKLDNVGTLHTPIVFGYDNAVSIGPALSDWNQADASLEVAGTFHVTSTSQFDGSIGSVNAATVNASSINVTTSGSLYSAGAKVGLDFSAYVSLGTPFTLTTTTNTINVGSSSMTVTLASSGTYSLNGFTTLFENGSTFAANDFITMHIYRQNNTPGKLTNSQVWYETPVAVSALTATIGQMRTPPDLKYTTTNTNDVLSLQIQISAAPGAGSVQAKESGLVATRLY